ncbi:MAG: hypothetical protein KDA58_10805, partial [Planctomycetaceae bacterium]|nr:hypothetical protein [Planctomycetaceae bacterium]
LAALCVPGERAALVALIRPHLPAMTALLGIDLDGTPESVVEGEAVTIAREELAALLARQPLDACTLAGIAETHVPTGTRQISARQDRSLWMRQLDQRLCGDLLKPSRSA